MRPGKSELQTGALRRRSAMLDAAHRSPHLAGRAGERADAEPASERRSHPHVFISYSHKDCGVAERLAGDLRALGIPVWWDDEIRSGENFSEAIQAALEAAKAVIVIWSQASVRSEQVRNEATFARDRNTLITTHVAAFDSTEVPWDFGQRQCECVEDRARLLRSLERFDIRPRAQVSRLPGRP